LTKKKFAKILDKCDHPCYNNYRKKEREENKMKRFRLEHKHSGALTVVAGYDLYDACRRCGKDLKFWKLVEIF
jgi:hypothetical protein